MSTENNQELNQDSNQELNPEQLAGISGGRDSGQYYKLGRNKETNASEDDKELSDNDLSQVSGGSGDGGQYYRLGDRKDS